MKPGTDPNVFWGGNCVTLGWFFSILGAIEALACRLELAMPDTHPPAAERWEKIEASIQMRIPIDPAMIKFERMMRTLALDSAKFGDLPAIYKERLAEIGNYRAVPLP